jgi:CRP/FNR family transcriptional regulator, cyclic AMP receptor protein
LGRADFLRLLDRFPRMAVNLRDCLLLRLRRSADQIAGVQTPPITGRLSAFLLEAAEAEGIEDPAGGRRIPARLTQQQIAERIGATCETVSRALAELKNAGAVRCSDGCLVVVNRKKLRRRCAA